MVNDNIPTGDNVPKKTPSPYDLNSSDTPGNIITQVQLKGANYEEWARAMQTSLRARRKWGFVDGSKKKPDTSSAQMEDWWTVHSMIVSWILNTIEPSLCSTISYKENAKDLWDDIIERFFVINGPRIHQIKSELAKTKQRGMSIQDYYGKLKCLWEDLWNYDPFPSCTCAGCTCGVNTKLQKQREGSMVHKFLMGLHEDVYGTVRSNLLAVEPLPPLNKVYASLVQKERVRAMNRAAEDGNKQMELNASARHRSTSRDKRDNRDKSMVCTHCNRTGHEASGCFKIIGYPEWWGNKGKPDAKGGGPDREQTKPGSNNGKNKGVQAHANMASNSGANLENEARNVVGLTSEHIQTLIDWLNNLKSGPQEHMTGVKIGLPDGDQVVASMKGVVHLDTHITLKNVLYVPQLKCELISVTQLMDEENNHIQLTPNLCIIQDQCLKTLIGVGKR